MTHHESLYEKYAAMAEGARELAAAELADQVLDLINLAFHRSGKTNQELADALGVTKGRASQILNGDGNLRIASIAKVLDCLGFEAKITAVDAAGTELRRTSSRRRPPARAQSSLEIPRTSGSAVELPDRRPTLSPHRDSFRDSHKQSHLRDIKYDENHSSSRKTQVRS